MRDSAGGAPGSSPEPAGPAGVTLASLNLHGGRGADGQPFDVAEAVLGLRADITVLQEAWHADGQPDPLADAAQRLGAQLIRADLRTGTSLRSLSIAPGQAPGAWGIAAMTRLPVIAYEVAHLGRAPWDGMPRAAQLISVQTPGGILRIANTHLTHRFVSPLQLLALVRRLAGSPAPTVIAGDLNMPGPLTALAVGYSPAVTGRTFPARRPLVQLDHMLAGPGVSAHEGRVLPGAGSDHLPIRARLRTG